MPNDKFKNSAKLKKAYSYLVEKGMKPHIAAGFVGNFMQESGLYLNPDVYDKQFSNGNYYGIAQWGGERLTRLKKKYPKSYNTLESQLDYVMWELQNDPYEKSNYEKIVQAKDAKTAAALVSKYYERPNSKWAENAKRQKYSDLVYNSFNKKRPTPQYTPKPRYGKRKNADGTESTHLMAREKVGNSWKAFPRLFQENGKWVDMSKGDWKPAYEKALSTNEVYDFGDDVDAAINFADKGSWKAPIYSGERAKTEQPKDNTNVKKPKAPPTANEWLERYLFSNKFTDGGDLKDPIKYKTVSPGEEGYKEAYEEGTLGRVNAEGDFVMSQSLDEVFINPKGMPFYDKLSEEEKRHMKGNDPIARQIQAKAKDGEGFNANKANQFALSWLRDLPLSSLQSTQSTAVEGIEAMRGNPYNLMDAFIPGEQRLPSQTVLKDEPKWVQGAGDILFDPLVGVGTGAIGIKGLKKGAKRLAIKNPHAGLTDPNLVTAGIKGPRRVSQPTTGVTTNPVQNKISLDDVPANIKNQYPYLQSSMAKVLGNLSNMDRSKGYMENLYKAASNVWGEGAARELSETLNEPTEMKSLILSLENHYRAGFLRPELKRAYNMIRELDKGKTWDEIKNSKELRWFRDEYIGKTQENAETVREMFKNTFSNSEDLKIAKEIRKDIIERNTKLRNKFNEGNFTKEFIKLRENRLKKVLGNHLTKEEIKMFAKSNASEIDEFAYLTAHDFQKKRIGVNVNDIDPKPDMYNPEVNKAHIDTPDPDDVADPDKIVQWKDPSKTNAEPISITNRELQKILNKREIKELADNMKGTINQGKTWGVKNLSTDSYYVIMAPLRRVLDKVDVQFFPEYRRLNSMGRMIKKEAKKVYERKGQKFPDNLGNLNTSVTKTPEVEEAKLIVLEKLKTVVKEIADKTGQQVPLPKLHEGTILAPRYGVKLKDINNPLSAAIGIGGLGFYESILEEIDNKEEK